MFGFLDYLTYLIFGSYSSSLEAETEIINYSKYSIIWCETWKCKEPNAIEEYIKSTCCVCIERNVNTKKNRLIGMYRFIL